MSSLVCAIKYGRPNALIVVFNSYVHHAGRQKDLPMETYFEGYKILSNLNSTVIWISETESRWYLEHEVRIYDFLKYYISQNNVDRVALLGVSAGGYGAIRHGILLSCANFPTNDPQITSFAINPQTGFQLDLVRKILCATESEKWSGGNLGDDPIILNQFWPEMSQYKMYNIPDFSKSFNYKNNSLFHIYYDSGNPIDRIFAEELIGLHSFYLHPKTLALPHRLGGKEIWKDFWKSGKLVELLADSADFPISLARLEQITI